MLPVFRNQSRERRTCFGEMVQIDGSPHAWFEERGASCCLILLGVVPLERRFMNIDNHPQANDCIVFF